MPKVGDSIARTLADVYCDNVLEELAANMANPFFSSIPSEPLSASELRDLRWRKRKAWVKRKLWYRPWAMVHRALPGDCGCDCDDE